MIDPANEYMKQQLKFLGVVLLILGGTIYGFYKLTAWMFRVLFA